MRKALDLNKEFSAALARYWAREDAARAEGYDFRGSSWYVTATDLEREVRDTLAAAFYDGGGRGNFRISTGRPGGLLQAARSWLFTERSRGRLESHNFGRGHVSGERFKRPGTGLSEAEQATMERRAKPTAVHAYRATEDSRALCTVGRVSKAPWRRPRRLWTSDDPAKVTCPRCRKLAAERT